MRVLPAVDLREGACVQLVGGDYQRERVRIEDPRSIRRGWRELGFRELHVVDLDAATGRGDNSELLRELLSDGGCVQVGGGVRDAARVAELLEQGAARVVVGTRAIEDAGWLAQLAEHFPERLVVAADVRDREVVTRGWTRGSGRDVEDFVRSLEQLPLAGLLVTAVHLEGQLQGTDLALMARLARLTRHPLQASGGVSTLEDVRALKAHGVSRAIVGMALYTGAIDSKQLAKEFGE